MSFSFVSFKPFLTVIMLLFVLVSFTDSNAQVETSSELFKELARKDSLLFEEGFNKCNRGAFEELIDADFEFYHDVAGLQDRAGFFRAWKANICGDNAKPLRELVPGSLQVFPLKDSDSLYGAIQKGEHRFYIKEDSGREPRLTGIAKFTHLWMLEKEQWRLKRVLSYDHTSAEE